MENEKIEVYQKKSTLLQYIVSSIFTCAVMIFMIFTAKVGGGGPRTKMLLSTPAGVEVAKVFFAVCAAFCLYSAVIFIKRLINYKPLIILDESGFTDNSGAEPIGFIPWSDVERIYMVTMKHNKLIQVELFHPKQYLNCMGERTRKAAELNMKLGYQPISFSLNGTGKDPDKFLADMISIWERNK